MANQSVFAGSYTVKSQVTRVRRSSPSSRTPRPSRQRRPPAVEKVEVTLSDLATAAPITDRQPKAKSGRPELTEAQIVVPGGRHRWRLQPGRGLRRQLGAAVGASRAAVDAGGTRTPARSARPASRCPRSSMWRRASPAPSSTGPAGRRPRRSSRSTRTRRRRSSSSSTWCRGRPLQRPPAGDRRGQEAQGG